MARHASRYGAYEIDSLPGQSQVAVCHSFVVPEDRRGQGFGHLLKAEQACDIEGQHYDFALCTVSASNVRQKRVLIGAGWQYLTSFRNRRSSETTELWCKGAAHCVEKQAF